MQISRISAIARHYPKQDDAMLGICHSLVDLVFIIHANGIPWFIPELPHPKPASVKFGADFITVITQRVWLSDDNTVNEAAFWVAKQLGRCGPLALALCQAHVSVGALDDLLGSGEPLEPKGRQYFPANS
jgi:hypothetical protein